MNFTRIFLVIGFILTCIAVVPAQEQCKLNIAQSPALRGLRLGMSFEQAKKAFPDLQINHAGEFGDVFVTASKDEPRVTDKSKFDGLYSISTYFLDNRLVQVSANYDSSLDWKSLDQFTAKVSEGLRLPNAWQGQGKMQCNGFEFKANINSLSMLETSWIETVQKRAEEKREKQRQAFKP